jgi:hypothetical protein
MPDMCCRTMLSPWCGHSGEDVHLDRRMVVIKPSAHPWCSLIHAGMATSWACDLEV